MPLFIYIYIYHTSSDWNSLSEVKLHFHVCAAKDWRFVRPRQCSEQILEEGAIAVATSEYELWTHYTVKGAWVDSLWSAHKLPHETFVDNANLGYPSL